MKLLLLFSIILVSFCAGIFYQKYIVNRFSMVHVLEKPLEIITDEEKPSFIPAGTYLYYDGSLKNISIDRYYIYVNVEHLKLPLRPVENPYFISPLVVSQKSEGVENGG